MIDITQEKALPIRHAIQQSSASCLSLALENATPEMLHYAVLKFREAPPSGSPEDVQSRLDLLLVLLASGAPIESTYDRSSSTLLAQMAGIGELALVQRLIDAGASINGVASLMTQGKRSGVDGRVHRAPLAMAAYRGHADVVETLLAAGCDVDKVDERGQSPLFYAAEGGFVDIMERLAAKGADPRRLDDEGGSIAHAFLACMRKLSRPDFEKGINLLIQWNVDLERETPVGASFMDSLPPLVPGDWFEHARSLLAAHRLDQSASPALTQTRAPRL